MSLDPICLSIQGIVTGKTKSDQSIIEYNSCDKNTMLVTSKQTQDRFEKVGFSINKFNSWKNETDLMNSWILQWAPTSPLRVKLNPFQIDLRIRDDLFWTFFYLQNCFKISSLEGRCPDFSKKVCPPSVTVGSSYSRLAGRDMRYN